ncbi:glycosyltransferase [Thermospira aquatica]|uniref:Glycosyltransferase n=1 Tax=Thermospira aquatica TaxID=2828656 RepID=A0AAX3BF56_9SPIR|nr:glycosyltransferase [Thermospira aquatica]
MALAPIVLFVYKRLWHTQQVVEALLRNPEAKETDLFIYSDGPKAGAEEEVQKLREYLRSIRGFKSINIVERETNWGLAKNIIDGVTNVVNKYSKVIVIEDDIVVSPGFLRYMNEALQLYENSEKVAGIAGYMYPIKKWQDLPKTFFLRKMDCWGWGTWKRAWELYHPDAGSLYAELMKRKDKKRFDWGSFFPYYSRMLVHQKEGKISTWDIQWYATVFLHDMFFLYPRQSLVQNIGFDESGTHTFGVGKVFHHRELPLSLEVVKHEVIEEHPLARKRVTQFLRWIYLRLLLNMPLSLIVKRLWWRFFK